MFFAAAIHVLRVCFSQDEAIVRDLVQLSDAGVVRREEQEPLSRVRRAVWGMLYADDTGIVSKSAERLAKMKTVIVTVSEEAVPSVSEKKTETMNVSTNTRPDNPRTTACLG